MTKAFIHVIVGLDEKIGPQERVRKGTHAHGARDFKAMMQIHTNIFRNTYRSYDLLGTFMPSADKAERYHDACLTKAGSSGYLGPGACVRILE